jgi:ubiquinone/menaquinone biosynthesis C-methylase UbiE
METVHKDKAQEHFDRWAKTYNKGRITEWFRAFQQRTIAVISPQPGDRILDVGCGPGWAVLQISTMLTEGRACGIDLSPGMIAQAKAGAAGLENVEFKVGDAENIPYEDAQFDAILCSSSFHHYPNPVKALREFHRVLKLGGRAYILETCRDNSFLTLLYDLGQKLLEKDHIRYYHSQEIKAFFQEAGFSEIQQEFLEQQLFLYGKFLTSEILISAKKA